MDVLIMDIEAAYLKIGEHDVDFLKEVLKDLIDELDGALESAPTFIASGDFSQIKVIFHRIKGSAAMLCCENIRSCCTQLQQIGESGMAATSPEEALLHQGNSMSLFQAFVSHTDILKSNLREAGLVL